MDEITIEELKNNNSKRVHSSGVGNQYVSFDKLEVGALSNRGKVEDPLSSSRVHIFKIVETN